MYNLTFTEQQLDTIADSLAQKGYILLENTIDQNLLSALYSRVHAINDDAWTAAGIGRGDQFQVNKNIRSDKIHWLKETNDIESHFINTMDILRQGLNQRLFLGLFDYECHFSIYQPGQFYAKHLDALKGKSNRVLSTVLYLNKEWENSDAGQLKLYNESHQVLDTITPRFGSLIIFLSEQFPHEVLPSNKERFSIAGWFRVNNNQHGMIDPSH